MEKRKKNNAAVNGTQAIDNTVQIVHGKDTTLTFYKQQRISEELKNIPLRELIVHGVLEPADNFNETAQTGICCPFCNSGHGENHTGAGQFNDDNTFYCHACNNEPAGGHAVSTIDLYMTVRSINNFSEACKEMATEFGIQPAGLTLSPEKPKKREDKNDQELLQIIREDINRAKLNIKDLPVNQRRGLSMETLTHFDCGFLKDWTHPKFRLRSYTGTSYISRRIIIPTSQQHYNAVMLPCDRIEQNKEHWKNHTKNVELFNKTALLSDSDVVVAVEGEIDAMSIWQASAGKIAVVGVIGGNKNLLLDAIKRHGISGKKFLILFDNDAGQDNAQRLRDALTKLGHCAVSKIFDSAMSDDDRKSFSGKIDANELLQARGNEFLNALTEKIIADARADFETAELNFADQKNFDEQIAIWRSAYDNAPINPDVLAKLKEARDFISELTVDTFKTSYAVDIAVRRKVALCKFYIPDLAQKFFSVMKNAQQTAMLKVKDLKAQKPPVVIPDELVTLANIAKSKTESDVDELLTRIKADQKNYELKLIVEEHQRKTKAQENAYEENPPSTKQAFADCPIDLILPNGVYLDANEGIRRVDWDKPVGRYGRPVINICTTPIVPIKIFREPTKHVTQYEVAIRTGDIWRRVVVDGRALIDPRKVAELADYGALIKNPAHLAKYFAEIIGLPKNKGRIPEIKCYQRPGWRGDKFIYPSGGEDYICRRSNIDYEKLFATKGDPDEWKKKFVEATSKSPIHRIFVGAAAASTFLEKIGEPNFWLHIFGKKNSSKTPLLKLALSIFGNPNELMRTFDSSAKNMVAMAVGLNSFPQGIDELEALGKKGEEELQKSIYDLHAGKDRQKNTRSGDVRQMETFHTVRLTTGEKPLHKPTDKGGAYKRAIDLYISDYLFDVAYGRDLHLFLARNHGHYGRAWAEYNEKFKDEIIADFDATSKELFAQFGTTFEPAHITAFAASTVGFWHLRKCMELEEKFDTYHALADARMTLRLLPTAEEISDTKRGVDLLASWVDEHPKNFIIENDSGDFISALSFNETSGIKFADGRVAFFPQAFRRICEQELQLSSYEKLLNELFDEEKLICPSRREKRKSVKLSGTVKKLYMFKAGVLIFPANNDALVEGDYEV